MQFPGAFAAVAQGKRRKAPSIWYLVFGIRGEGAERLQFTPPSPQGGGGAIKARRAGGR
jgi:hypothetical protein